MFEKLAASVAVAAILAATGSAAFAQGAPAKGATKSTVAKGQTYDVEFVFDNTPYSGTMVLQIAKKGGPVGGKMEITRPSVVNGDVAGTLTGETLSLDYPFTMVQENCTGRVVVTAKMTPKRDVATGTATASGCGDNPLEGTFSLKKAAKPTTD